MNGALDVGQTGRDAKPLNALAEQAGLPTWLVDVRHGITHQSCPPTACYGPLATNYCGSSM